MGETADEVKQRYERLSHKHGNVESMGVEGTEGASHPVQGTDTDPYADTQSDTAFTEGAAGAAYASSAPIGLASESTLTAPLGEDLVDDPYGEVSRGAFIGGTSSSDLSYSADDETSDTSDDDIEATRAQIEQTRSEMSTTINAIQEKLSPANLAEQAKDTVRDATIGKAQNFMNDATDTAREAVSNAGDTALSAVNNAGDTARSAGTSLIGTIRQNPIPAALAGLGLGWLIMKSRQSSGSSQNTFYSSNSGYDYRYNPGSSSNSGSSNGGLSQVQNTVGDAASRVQDRAGQMTDQVQDKAGQLAGQVSSTASDLGEQAQGAAQQVSGTFSQTLQENPLVLAAGVFAAGLAAGMAIPETERENQLMGSARETLGQKAQQAVQDTAQKVQTVAHEAAGAAKQEAQDQNLT